MENRKSIAKWGFGMAPISLRMQRRYDTAVQTTLDLLNENIKFDEVNVDDLSELKGMFNRCIRQDQWDWFSVFTELGEPPLNYMRQITNNLKMLRDAIIKKDCEFFDYLKQKIIKNNILYYLDSYQSNINCLDKCALSGWIYILSTREQPNILKIGMTHRSVAQRVKEINSATGVLVPFSARRVFRVKNASVAEKEIFELLKEYRIRRDREFFELSFSEAANLIEIYLFNSRMQLRKTGVVIWFDQKKSYGFINSQESGSEDIFFHISEIKKEYLSLITTGTIVEFDLGLQLKGPCALEIQVIQ